MSSREPVQLLAANVRRLRAERGLTQEQIANAAGLALSDVGRIERGERDPGVRVLAKLAHGLGVEVEDLVRRQPD
ncbi:helix-turn-helix transcriptional regulator [Conexibacter sp. JD483]|uniref:helix-turn-helix domain-containing protein n=1 Tax=unclassified Conexibacter TaxID=2627773 RepID=UPI002725116C|nr:MULTISPECIES: helix-turn-helix transcriptional regulator [unclassified Conexibacter]MDO8185969.1 helix-turn-helix transcriptional regulator [Conexibacter sp. CPCC 205706]MDO8199460.1 helix-turn-helix transcriptional regulator [Conexibacter sp. CPCC 205762]MDR9368578.1 helix-turn-helix transcriptional regulator [Conexibacter sp. JD483]